MQACEHGVIQVFVILERTMNGSLVGALMDGGLDSLDVVGVSLQGTWVELAIVEANVESAQTGTVRAVVRSTKDDSLPIESHEKSADLEENGDDIAIWERGV